MLILLPILILGLSAAGVGAIHLVKRGFAYAWLIAALGGLFAWPMVLLTGMRLPQSLQLFAWQPAELFAASPLLVEDGFSWPFALALATLGLSVILTAVALLQSSSWRPWSFSLLMIAVSIFSVMAGNPVTLLISWAALDLLEAFLLLNQVQESAAREKIAASFIARAAGILLLYWAVFAAQIQGETIDFTNLPPSTSIYLVLAAGLRLGVLPLHVPFLQELPLRRGLGTILRLAPAASSFMLLTRIGAHGLSGPLAPVLFILALLTAVYGAWGWASADHELNGRAFWIMSTAGLSLAAAVNGVPGAARAWGITCILTGSVLFLASARPANLRPVLLLGALGLTTLPFSPGWYAYQLVLPGAATASPVVFIVSIFLIILAQTLLLLGFLRHAWQAGVPIEGAERWVWLIYPVGLLILPLAHFAIGFIDHPDLSSLSVWTGAVAVIPLLLAGGLFFTRRKMPGLPLPFISALRTALSLSWLYHLLWLAYQGGRRLISWMDFILEGQGGLLWAFLILALLFTLLAGQGAGG